MRLATFSPTLEEAEAFLHSRQQHYATAAGICLVVGIRDEADGGHGVVIARRVNETQAALVHVYSDGAPGGYSLLYGTAWRALKAMGFKTVVL